MTVVSKKKKPTCPFSPKKGRDTCYLEDTIGHGFEEFRSGEAMENYFNTDPSTGYPIDMEPPMSKSKPSEKDKAISRGEL